MIQFWTILLAALTALCCAVPGTFLVLKRESLVSEALAHGVLPGIVLAFILVGDRTSPALIVGAALAGVVMVLLADAIRRTRMVDPAASLGVVFPALFSIGIVLASSHLSNVHFHADCIIDGNLAAAPLDRLVLFGTDVGPKAVWSVGGVLLLVLLFVATFFKELVLTAFDEGLASSLRLRPALVNTGFIALVALSAVATFEAAGSVLVVALMIAPPAAAALWTNDVRRLLLVACAFALASAGAGYWFAFERDLPPNGAMAVSAGIVFLVSFLAAPRGALAGLWRTRRVQRELETELVAARIGVDEEGRERRAVAHELGWSPARAAGAIDRALALGSVRVDTSTGRLVLADGSRRTDDR